MPSKGFFPAGVITLVVLLIAGLLYFTPSPDGQQEDERRPEPYEGELLQEEEEGLENDLHNGEKEYENNFFLGVSGDRIAVFRDNNEPELVEVLPYPVKDVYYEELKKGIPFSTEEEKIRLLENLSS